MAKMTPGRSANLNQAIAEMGLDPSRLVSLTLDVDADGSRCFIIEERYTIPATDEQLLKLWNANQKDQEVRNG